MTIGIDVRLWGKTGVGRYIRNLCVNLQRIDNKNSYVLFANSEDLLDVESKISNPKWKIVIANIRWHTLSEQINFLKILNAEKLDLMHFPYISVPIFYKRKFVVTVHDLIPFHFPTGKASTLPKPIYWMKRIGYERVIKSAVSNCQKIIVPLNAVKDDISNTLKIKKDKIAVTLEGADEETQLTKSDLPIKLDFEKYILYVGNAYPHKNLDRLIRAFLDLNLNNVRLVLVGSKDHFYEKLEREVTSKRIVFWGRATDEELSFLYKNALVYVQPSLMEGFGLTVLEAMKNKCLVIASDIPSLREVTKGEALFFNPRSEKELSKQLGLVIKGESGFEDIIEKAYEHSLEFSWKKMAEETLRIYESSISIR